MEIKNEQTAQQWMAAWNWKPRNGIRQATIAGLRMSLAISQSAGHTEAAAGYRAALAVIEQ